MKINKYEMMMEPVASYNYPDTEIDGSDAAADFLRNSLHMDKLASEHFIVLTLATDGTITGFNQTSAGTLSETPVHPREVFKYAIAANAYAIIIAHNHPSGNIGPSEEDQEVTRRLKKCADMLGIKLLDHIIIGSGGNYTSFRECGYLN